MELILAIPLGLAIGLVVGTVGGGGAILALPALVYVLGEGVGPASTASLIVVAVGASAGAVLQAHRGRVCWDVALLFSIPAVLGAFLGAVANRAASGTLVIGAFVPVMLVAAALTYRRGAVPDVEPAYPDRPRRAPGPASASGLVVGAMTGFFGVGGGFLIVPALTTLLGLGMRRAIATSLVIITITGGAALASHLIEGAAPDWPLTISLAGSAALGALAGGLIGGRLPTKTLAHLFAVIVAAVALFLLADLLVLGGPPTDD